MTALQHLQEPRCSSTQDSDGRHSNALCRSAGAKLTQGDYEGAIADSTMVLKLDPMNLKANLAALVARGSAKTLLGDYRGAVADYTEALRHDPTNEYIFFSRGEAKNYLGDYRGAVADCTEALRHDPTNVHAFCNRGEAKNYLEDYQGAVADTTEALKHGPKSVRLLFVRGEARVALRDHQGAVFDATEALKLDPKNDPLFRLRGNAKYALGDHSGAVSDFTKASQLNPACHLARSCLEKAQEAVRIAEHLASAAGTALLAELDEESAPSQSKRASKKSNKKKNLHAKHADSPSVDRSRDDYTGIPEVAGYSCRSSDNNDAGQHVACNAPGTITEEDATGKLNLPPDSSETGAKREEKLGRCKKHFRFQGEADNPWMPEEGDTRCEILSLFRESGLPIEAAIQLTNPNGEHNFRDLVQFAKFVNEDDLKTVGLQTSARRELKERLDPGGDIFNSLVISNRLVPTKVEPPKGVALSDNGNPNDGSSSASKISSTGSRNSRSSHLTTGTEITILEVPRRIKERVQNVTPQLYEQDRLAEVCGEPFQTLREASESAFAQGVIDQTERARLRGVNVAGNFAKHGNFGKPQKSAGSRG